MDRWGGREEESRTDALKVLFYDLNTAISPREDRISALKAVLDECNHHDHAKHDLELDLSADKILFQKLAFLFCVRKVDDEIGLLACALEMVYRASRERVALSFNQIGDATLPLFVDMIRCDARFPPLVPLGVGTGGSVLGVSSSAIGGRGRGIAGSTNGSAGDSGSRHGLFASHSGGGENSHTDTTTNRDSHAASHRTDVPAESSDQNSNYQSNRHSLQERESIDITNSMTCNIAKAARMQQLLDGEASTQCTTDVTLSTEPPTITTQQSHSSSSRNDLTTMMMANGTSGSRRWRCSTNPMAVRKIIKVLRYYSRVLSAMIPMARHPGLLDAIIFQLQWGQQQPKTATIRSQPNTATSRHSAPPSSSTTEGSDNNDDDGRIHRVPDVTSAARIDAMATLVNLACAEENKSKLLYHPGLLEAVIAVAGDDLVDEAREHAAIVLMNLALADMNKLFMASQDHVLDILLKLIADDKSPHTRRYASTTIFTLASVAQNTRRIVDYSDGRIISALMKVLRSDQVDEVRINAAETVFNMMRNTNDVDVVEALADHCNLLSTLANSVRTDYSADVRAYCARSLEWLAADIHSPSLCHGALLNALTSASFWTKTTCIGEAFKTQSSLTQNRKAMVEHEGLLDALATLASLDGINDDDVRDCALTAIERLTKEGSTLSVMAAHAGIMTVLTGATFQKVDAMEEFGFKEREMEGGDHDNMHDGVKYLAKSALKNLAEVL